MHYSTAVAFEGDTAKAFDLATAALTSLGFRTIAWDGSSLEMVGPPMTSTRQSALVGASRIRLVHDADELSIDAELGGVRRMSRFVTYFPLGLCVVLFATFSIVFGLVLGHEGWEIPVLAVTGGNALLWLILAPMITRHVRGRTCRGIDALLENMAIAGRNQEPQRDPFN